MTEAAIRQTKTIHEYLADEPDVDVSATHAALWDILSELRDRAQARFPMTQQPASEGLDYWATESGDYEGSLTTWTGPQTPHVAHSWIGNRKASILDMNFQIWLGPHIDVPHLVVVFGTIPLQFYYSELVPRRDLMVDTDYLAKYYDEDNADYLAMRGDTRFTWSVSHGTYMRAFLSPSAHSYTAERSDETLEILREAVNSRFDRWLSWVDRAEEVPADQQLALLDRDQRIRRNGYVLDPMNKISEGFLGVEHTAQLLAVRYGRDEIAASRAAHGLPPLD